MWRRVWCSVAVLLVILAFLLIAVHACVLQESPFQQHNCPLCLWLHNLMKGDVPALFLAGAPAVGRALLEPVLVFLDKPHAQPFSARSPPGL